MDVINGQIGLSFSIYKVFTGSNRSLFFALQGFYRVKSAPFFGLQCYYRVKLVTLFRFTRFLQSQISLPFSNYNVITRLNRSLFLDLQGFYRVKSVSLFRFSVFLKCEMIPSLFDLQGLYIIFTRS